MDGGDLAGITAMVAGATALAHGARAVRRSALPGWCGARAALAVAVVAIATGVVVARLCGAVGLLTGAVLLPAEIAAGLALAWAAPRLCPERGHMRDLPDKARGGPPSFVRNGAACALFRTKLEWGVAGVAVGVVVVQWVAHGADAVGRGMVHADTLWYHGPFAARFVQTGGFGALDGVGYEAARWFPLDGQLVHAVGMLAVGGDGLSPLVNLGWLGLALLAAWCIGERRGAGPIALATVSVVLGAPLLAATQPGQMSTDIGCAALLLAAVALALESDLHPAPLAIAGTAAGLALGTKVTVAGPVAVLALAVTVLVLRSGGRRSTVAWWLTPIVVLGAFWFGRTWVLTGSPLPWFRIPGLADRVTTEGQAPSLLAARDLDRATWDTTYLPGLRQALGPAWPVVAALALLGVGVVLRRGRPTLERVVGLLVVAGLVGHLATPLTAGLTFGFNLRYLGPTLLLGAALAPLAVGDGRIGRVVLGGGAVVLIGIDAALADHVERIPAWPDTTPIAVGVAAVVAALVFEAVALHRRGRVPPGVLGAAGVVLATAAAVPMLDIHDDRRYVTADLPPTDALAAALRDERDLRVGLFGAVESYPLFGRDLSNRVEMGSAPPLDGSSPCMRWRAHLGDRYDVVVVSRYGLMPLAVPPPEVFAGDPAVEVIARDGDHVAYRLHHPLDPTHCPI